ncbi:MULTISPECIES: hypothetical protein [unclassified Mucilaginibacter]|uniref:hypothetical protein n=1 Tax=unclassified Mucilaginibacter TaxID=2617802 RepID=UPI002AC955BE|nr:MULTISPECIES: hypothetical protein [unclassified Mucilaginibacter]MEB0277124.1 hypothetical protein [Mucilaginibacter sp. 10B2]MEB0301430.1 hypothetical protein [Mucilaginibacter sp. 5C4]WPX25224.1 hypothetical protein RHM67_08085 [Mucilaginibacter sp. 5C4]
MQRRLKEFGDNKRFCQSESRGGVAVIYFNKKNPAGVLSVDGKTADTNYVTKLAPNSKYSIFQGSVAGKGGQEIEFMTNYNGNIIKGHR